MTFFIQRLHNLRKLLILMTFWDHLVISAHFKQFGIFSPSISIKISLYEKKGSRPECFQFGLTRKLHKSQPSKILQRIVASFDVNMCHLILYNNSRYITQRLTF